MQLGGNEVVKVEVLCFPTICTPLPPILEVNQYPCLRELELADNFAETSDAIDLLVGSDYYWAFVTGEVIRTNGGPTAVSSKLGWLLSGPTDGTHTMATHANLSICEGIQHPISFKQDDALLSSLKSFWELESIGTQDTKQPTLDPPEEMFLTKLRFSGTQYEVGLPWTRDPFDMPDHYQMCFNRLMSLQQRLLKEPQIMSEYDQTIREQMNKGIVERVPKITMSNQQLHNPVHYMRLTFL